RRCAGMGRRGVDRGSDQEADRNVEEALRSDPGAAGAADGAAQERKAERQHVRGLLEIAGAVPALRRLVEEYPAAEFLEARRHLAGVAGMHAVVARRGP